MKYIFEYSNFEFNFKDKDWSDDLYISIGSFEYLQKTTYNIEPYSTNEISHICNLVEGLANKYNLKLNCGITVDHNNVKQPYNVTLSETLNKHHLNNFLLTITKCKDSWFYILDRTENTKKNNHFFKCDDIEGVCNYLKTRILDIKLHK